jgi:hypothetical protein
LRPVRDRGSELLRPYLKEQVECGVHVCNPSYEGSIDSSIEVWGQLRQKRETPSDKYLKQKGVEAWLKW